MSAGPVEIVSQDFLVDVRGKYVLHRPTGRAHCIDFIPAEWVCSEAPPGSLVAVAVLVRTDSPAAAAITASAGRDALRAYIAAFWRTLWPDTAPHAEDGTPPP